MKNHKQNMPGKCSKICNCFTNHCDFNRLYWRVTFEILQTDKIILSDDVFLMENDISEASNEFQWKSIGVLRNVRYFCMVRIDVC